MDGQGFIPTVGFSLPSHTLRSQIPEQLRRAGSQTHGEVCWSPTSPKKLSGCISQMDTFGFGLAWQLLLCWFIN